MPFLKAQQVDLPACFPQCPFNVEPQAGREAVNTNFQVIDWTRLGIKPEQAAPAAALLPLGHLDCQKLISLYKNMLGNTNYIINDVMKK